MKQSFHKCECQSHLYLHQVQGRGILHIRLALILCRLNFWELQWFSFENQQGPINVVNHYFSRPLTDHRGFFDPRFISLHNLATWGSSWVSIAAKFSKQFNFLGLRCCFHLELKNLQKRSKLS